MDPEYVSGGGAAKNIEEKVVAVFDREFALALQQVDVKACFGILSHLCESF